MRFAATLAALACGCTSPEPATDTTATTGQTTSGSTDDPATSSTSAADTSTGTTAATTDATSTSTSAADTSSGPADTTSEGSTSTTGDAAGLGELSGECGLLDATELRSASPFTLENAIDFDRLGFDYDLLTPDGQAVFDAGNLGGSSLHSEVIAFEVLARCEGASLVATEGEIVYEDDMGTKTDLLVDIDGLMVGVSVTRAVGFPLDDPYPLDQATALLEDKLGDVLASTANVAPEHAWVKQVLHVVAYADMHAARIFEAYAALGPELTADTLVVVTVTHGDDDFIY